MSKVTATMTPVGGMSGGLSPLGGLTVGMTPVSAPVWELTPSRMTGSMTLVSGSSAGMIPVYDPDLNTPFLDITPKILWIADWGTNKVISNTDWNIE